MNEYCHWIFGENILREDEPTYLINLEKGISIRFDYGEGYFKDFDEFFGGVADVQFFYGDRPDKNEVEAILTEGWNFLCHFEREQEKQLQDEDDIV